MNWLKRLLKSNNLMTLNKLSQETGIKYMTLYMAVRMNRLEATWDGHVWLSSVEAVERAVREGKLQGVEE